MNCTTNDDLLKYTQPSHNALALDELHNQWWPTYVHTTITRRSCFTWTAQPMMTYLRTHNHHTTLLLYMNCTTN